MRWMWGNQERSAILSEYIPKAQGPQKGAFAGKWYREKPHKSLTSA